MMNTSTEEVLMYWDAELSEVDGFWYHTSIKGSMEAFRANFQPKGEDVVILASSPKTGTTWLKALAHSILFRGGEDDLLTKMNPHVCVPSLESIVYHHDPSSPPVDPDQFPLLNTHMAYSYLPNSVKRNPGGCKIVYIARNPKDTMVSQWHFFNKIFGRSEDPMPLKRAAEIFCSGVMPFGPFYEHVLEYWEASKRSPDKVMFIKYEDLRGPDTKIHVRKLASFLSRPFGDGTEGEGEVDKVIWRSSFDRLKELDVNKNGKPYPQLLPHLTNNLFFRRGEVGDWRNHLTADVAKYIDDFTEVKFRGTGLYLDEDREEQAVCILLEPLVPSQ